MEKKKQIKSLKRELDDNAISIKTFLTNYYGIYNRKIATEGITHKVVKTLLPHIKRTSFESILQDKKNLYIGNIIAVRDSEGHVLPYINPNLENIEYIGDVDDIETNTKKDKILEEVVLDSNLSTYELSILCKEFKELNRMREYRIANKLLKEIKRPKNKKYQLLKRGQILKGIDEYEKY